MAMFTVVNISVCVRTWQIGSRSSTVEHTSLEWTNGHWQQCFHTLFSLLTQTFCNRAFKPSLHPFWLRWDGLLVLYQLTLCLLIRQSRSCSASDSTYCYTFVRSVVCLSVVWHTRAPCLNHWTDLDAIWLVHFVGSDVTGGCRVPEEGEILEVKLPAKTCNSYAETWRILLLLSGSDPGGAAAGDAEASAAAESRQHRTSHCRHSAHQSH